LLTLIRLGSLAEGSRVDPRLTSFRTFPFDPLGAGSSTSHDDLPWYTIYLLNGVILGVPGSLAWYVVAGLREPIAIQRKFVAKSCGKGSTEMKTVVIQRTLFVKKPSKPIVCVSHVPSPRKVQATSQSLGWIVAYTLKRLNKGIRRSAEPHSFIWHNWVSLPNFVVGSSMWSLAPWLV
jgi:hypothetical protein